MAGTTPILAAAALILAVAVPAHAQRRESLAQDLSTCAGAVAAQANVNLLTYELGGSGELAPLLDAILRRLNVEPNLEGMTGRSAAADAKRYWVEQPRRRRQAAINRCRTRFGGQ